MLWLDRIDMTQEREKPVQCRPIAKNRDDDGVAKLHVTIYGSFIDGLNGDPFPCEPPAEVVNYTDVAPGTLLTMPFGQEASGKQLKVGSERTCTQTPQAPGLFLNVAVVMTSPLHGCAGEPIRLCRIRRWQIQEYRPMECAARHMLMGIEIRLFLVVDAFSRLFWHGACFVRGSVSCPRRKTPLFHCR